MENVLFPKDLNWVQHWVSRIGLLQNIELDIRGARNTELYEKRGNINHRRYDLVKKQNDSDNRQPDSKLCDLIYIYFVTSGVAHKGCCDCFFLGKICYIS